MASCSKWFCRLICLMCRSCKGVILTGCLGCCCGCCSSSGATWSRATPHADQHLGILAEAAADQRGGSRQHAVHLHLAAPEPARAGDGAGGAQRPAAEAELSRHVLEGHQGALQLLVHRLPQEQDQRVLQALGGAFRGGRRRGAHLRGGAELHRGRKRREPPHLVGRRALRPLPGSPVQFRLVGIVINDHQRLIELFEPQLLGGLRDLLLLLYDGPQGPLVPLVEVDLLPVGVDAHLVLYELLDRLPAIIDVYRWTEAKHSFKHAGTVRRAILFQDRADDRDCLPALARPQKNPRVRYRRHHGISRLLRAVRGSREQLDWPHVLPRVPCSTRSTCCFMDCCGGGCDLFAQLRGHAVQLALGLRSMPQQVTVITFFLACINAPISWKKAQLGNIVTWCGWTLHTDLESSHLAIGKLRKLQEQLEKLACSKKIPRKHLERALGLLMWATSTCTHLRPYMAPLYKDMYSGRGTLQQIHARDWRRFLDALSPDAVVQRQPLGMWLNTGSRLTEVGSQKIQCKADVPKVVSSAKPQWVRMSDPMSNEIHLRNESRAAPRWLSSCFSHDQLHLIRQAPQLHCLAAADAMAEGTTVGIGGWISTSQSFVWC